MRRWWCVLIWLGILVRVAAAQEKRELTFGEKYPEVVDMGLAIVGVGLIAGLIWWTRGGAARRNGFAIHVDEEGIAFTGNFPPGAQDMVENFLRDDCAIAGKYEVRGQWEEWLLIVTVHGAPEAVAMEQRIRNFLKLNVRKP